MELERRNAYFCNDCRRVTITVDVDEGVTQMFIKCKYCESLATSSMYNIPPSMRFSFEGGKPTVVKADYEWYKPNEKETLQLSKSEKEHVFNGGLLMRDRTDKEAIKLK